jgi:hypothetical protein
MRALQRLSIALVVLVVACKGKSTEPAVAPGSAVASGAAAATGSAAAGSAVAGSAAPGSDVAGSDVAAPAAGSAVAGKAYDGPTFTVRPTLAGPEIKKKDIDTDAGPTTMTMYEFTDPNDDWAIQMVESNAIPASAGSIPKLLESAIEGMTENVKAKVVDKHMVQIGSARGFDFTATWADENGLFFMRGRVAIKNNALYQVIAIGKGYDVTPGAESFASSFALK